MDFQVFLKKNLISYFIIVTGINAAIAAFGDLADPGRLFGYKAFYSPLIYGAIAVIPSFVFYSKVELTFRQMILRKILHFLLLEGLIVTFGCIFGVISGLKVAVTQAVIVLAVYLFTTVIAWLLDRQTMKDINYGLKRLQE